MEFTTHDKARLLQYVQPGKILECGCGSGTVLALIAAQFPSSEMIGVDYDSGLLLAASKRLMGRNVQLIDMDMRRMYLLPDWRKTFSTAIFSSSLHEVESDFGLPTAEGVLRQACDLLDDGGVLIWRDGVKPMGAGVVFRIKTAPIQAKFERFVDEYYKRVNYSLIDGGWISISSFDLHNFLCKYYFEGRLWERDMRETFGTRTLRDYVNGLPPSLTVTHAEAYTPEVLSDMWARHFEFGTAEPIASHMLIVARKRR
jgi:SAM-dependent methyltransferase